jgi:methyltransferase (TIGR00027 family)
MRNPEGSRTAIFVAFGRAAAHGRTPVARFSDPVAEELLPPEWRERLARWRAGTPPRTRRERWFAGAMRRLERMMPVRTVAIDDAIRERLAPQLVILGAGLDARAWRMADLKETIAFEVDHPATQQKKKERIGGRAPLARELRFVPVDFEKDSLDAALTAAGQDVATPTTWVWEGVINYLERDAIAATLHVIAKRSAPGSRLIATYSQAPRTLRRWISRLFLRVIGEPMRASYTSAQMRALVEGNGMSVVDDRSLGEHATRLGAPMKDERGWNAGRIVVAERAL